MKIGKPRSASLVALAAALALLALVSDQLSKAWILAVMQPPHNIPIMPLLSFDLVMNHGITFGLFKSHAEYMPFAWAGLAVGIVGVLLRWLWKADNRLVAAAIGMIVGGAVGNVIDRFRFGAVVDVIHVQYYPWLFNVADSAVVVGVILLTWDSFRAHPSADVRN